MPIPEEFIINTGMHKHLKARDRDIKKRSRLAFYFSFISILFQFIRPHVQQPAWQAAIKSEPPRRRPPSECLTN